MDVNFSKMEGLGNDFIFMDDRTGAIKTHLNYPDIARRLCHRHFGIGADGIILILNSHTEDIRFRIFNADGSEAQMCGNGMRCFAKLLFETGIIDRPEFHVETLAGRVTPKVFFDKENRVSSVRVDMGEPALTPDKIPFTGLLSDAVSCPVTVGDDTVLLTPVSMGNPHAVVFVPDIRAMDVEKTGTPIENHPCFPEKTNVEFIEIVNEHEINMRVWERGAGETLACGTGACAAVVASHLNGKTGPEVLVHLAGGDLSIYWDKKTNHIYKTGPATFVFSGKICL
ncbi:diaminopimelate epimerase [Desulfocicer vacuolatum DSM 3385]|uniref:Diaminopimelate epimerase n=1 Tax=Desulfocicer vacuolatum DSM 3385 TaxID=1121400 RepID=A0A1W2BUM2_9BACT|nr:diaminopimelate epimerase [Desulfocicer vacuolatum]SMC76680.1 diaminopimelate epimerase [Desulfocicer vacuolatum DSM 3385]